MIAKLVAFVVPLGFDTLAVAIALGFMGRSALRPALLFAAFETAMPLVGIALGRFFGDRFASIAAIAGGLILIAVGVHAFREAAEEGDDARDLSFETLRSAVLAGIAISTDELAVGFPIGTSGVPVAPILAAIGIQTFVVTFGGITLGRKLGEMLGRRAVRYSAVIAGTAFTGVGLWLILERFFGHP